MKTRSQTKLSEAIAVDCNKCINCHACIAACPVKYCNDGSGDTVSVNSDMCIACGKCISACTHKARTYTDDFDQFITDIQNGERIIAIVAPSVVSNFPNYHLHFNGWLKEIGIPFIFDVSFGAELTTKSYVDHIENNKQQTLIAQPCPSVVSYIQLYKPELIKHLAPIQSPMGHSVKIIRKYFPEYNNYKIAVISPCVAKKREFNELGIENYLITFQSIQNYFDKNDIKLQNYNASYFDTPKAERAVLFSSPGGLLQTAERWIPGISENTRKIEGSEELYPYFDKLITTIDKGMAPLLIDCLNCKNGCNAGPGSLAATKNIDEIDFFVKKASEHNKEYYKRVKGATNGLRKTIDAFWDNNLYKRLYKNLASNVSLQTPNKSQLTQIYKSMHKHNVNDLYNCVACGYNSCEKMAFAIFNGLNKPENCHHYLQAEKDISQAKTKKSEQRVNNILESAHDGFIQIDKLYIIQQVNKRLEEMLKQENVVGRSFFDFVDKKSADNILRHRELREKSQNSSYEITIIQADGNKITGLLSGSPLFNKEQQFIGSYAMISDISELKNAELALRASHLHLEEKVHERTEELNTMLEELQYSNNLIHAANKELEKLSIVASEIDNATIIMDSKGNFEWVNQGFVRLFEIQPEQVIGKNIISASTRPEIKEKIEHCIYEAKTINYEFQLIKEEHLPRWIQVTLTPILDLDNKIKKIIAIDTDITALKEKEIEILTQKEEIETQRDIARRQSSEIKSSIAYASRIQNALLPDIEVFNRNFKECFILFAPKYSVSGDFYWISERNNKVYLAVVDCTGHGVPGAFMSMLGISFLNEIVDKHNNNNISEASSVLNQLRKKIIKALNTNNNIGAKDGMDISMCIFDKQTQTVQFSAAIQSLFRISNSELTEIKGDRMPVGIYENTDIPFTNHTFKYKTGDQFYLFTDGIVDQFNHDNQRKLNKKRLREILLYNESFSMKQQHENIGNIFQNWRGNSKQVDDMLLVGLKV